MLHKLDCRRGFGESGSLYRLTKALTFCPLLMPYLAALFLADVCAAEGSAMRLQDAQGTVSYKRVSLSSRCSVQVAKAGISEPGLR